MNQRAPVAVLVATVLSVGVLGVIGLGVESHLQPTSLAIPGTASSQGEALARAHFGDSAPFAVMLRGPAGAIDRQGPALVAALRRRGRATAISPWDPAAPADLRPMPDRALILVDFHRPLGAAIDESVPQLERALEARIRSPVVAVQSGFATISRALQKESISASERAELLAAPLLIVVLLLVFRSAVAAAIPLALGAMTVLAGRGVLVLLSSFVRIDALSLVVCTMMGLALGVDYSLFIVSRFREELSAGHEPLAAARRTRRSAGRTTAFAGSTLFLSIFVSAFLQPGALLVSLAAALAAVTAISVAISWAALPSLLAILGPRVNAGQLRGRSADRRGASRSWAAGAAAAALRRPVVAAAAIALPLLLLTVPALAFNTGSPGVDELPGSSPARQDAEAISDAIGPGWEAPFVLVAASRQGPVTVTDRLALLARWQRRIAAEPGVTEVIGPAPIARAAQPLRSLGRRLEPSAPGGRPELARLGPGLRRASSAVTDLRGGLSDATAGSGLLGEGAARARQGAAVLAAGLDRASSGGEEAVSALGRLAGGAERLASGQRNAAGVAFNLNSGLSSLLPDFRAHGVRRARRLARSLERRAAEDPSLEGEAEQAAILGRVLESSGEELHRLRSIAAALEGGLGRLVAGGDRVAAGTRRLEGAAGDLGGGLGRLDGGAGRLATGLGELEGGADSLREGLAGGYRRTRPLQTGLRHAAASVAPLEQEIARLRRASPGVFHSGYITLAAIDGAAPSRRALAGETIDLEHGGQAARYLVIPSAGFDTPGSRAVGSQLRDDGDALAREGGMVTGISGGAATLNDYGSATKARLPLVIGAIVLITFLMLVAILRAPLLAALTVALNLLSVGAAIGVVSLVCKLPSGFPLGGHPYIDTVGAAAIFGVTFGLSIDYAVFLLARMRERYDAGADNAAAIRFGLDRTAGVITGAAAIMAAVFVSFATSSVATVSQMGIGLTVAILLDASVVRIVLLPALMLLVGERIWHVPPLLDRLLPRFSVHGMESEPARGRA